MDGSFAVRAWLDVAIVNITLPLNVDDVNTRR